MQGDGFWNFLEGLVSARRPQQTLQEQMQRDIKAAERQAVLVKRLTTPRGQPVPLESVLEPTAPKAPTAQPVVSPEAAPQISGSGIKKKMSKYNDFVKAHIKSAPGANQMEKMKAVAAMWKKQKGEMTGGSTETMDSTVAPQQGAGFKAKRVRKPTAERLSRPRIVAPAAGVDPVEPAQHEAAPALAGGRRRRVVGAGINLTAANELPASVMHGSGAYQQLAALSGGCASCDEAHALHGDGFNPAKLALGVLSTIMPAAGILGSFL